MTARTVNIRAANIRAANIRIEKPNLGGLLWKRDRPFLICVELCEDSCRFTMVYFARCLVSA